MLREKSPITTQAETAAFDSLIRHEYSERALQHISIADIGKIGVDAYLRSIVDAPAAPLQETLKQPEKTVSTIVIEVAPQPVQTETAPAIEVETVVNPRTQSALGRVATAPLRAASWVNKMHYVGMATVIGKLPGRLSKEELLARDQARQEKFAIREGDGLLTRTRKAFGRNALRAYAWLPTVAVGALSASPFLRPFIPELTHDLSAPWTDGVVSRPMTAADLANAAAKHTALPEAAIVPPAPVPDPHPAPMPIDAPAPKPSYDDLPPVKHKIDYSHPSYPSRAPVDSTPHPTPVEKKIPTNTGDIVIPVGGATDPDGNMPAATIDPNKSQILRVNYPAEMGPFVGSTPTNISQDIGVQNVINLVKQNPGANITLKGFSEGSFVTNEAARQLAEQGIHVTVINAGDGNGAAGILQRPEVPMIQPILNSAGINYTPPVPGTTELLSGRDAWASTAQDPLGVALSKAMNIPVDHRIPGDHEIPVQIFLKDGVTYKVYDQPVDLPMGAVDMTPGGSPVPVPAPAPAPIDQVPAPASAPLDTPPPAPVDVPPVVDPAPAPAPDPVQSFMATLFPPAPDPELAPAA